MRRTGLILGFAAAVAMSAGCAGEQREERQEAALAVADTFSGEEVTVTGCLTGTGQADAFALTASRDALTSALPVGDRGGATYTYELVGNAADLAQHVGQQVDVRGQLAEGMEKDVEVEREDQTTLEPRQSGDERVTPAIETETEAEILVRRLRVETVTPTGQPCQTARP